MDLYNYIDSLKSHFQNESINKNEDIKIAIFKKIGHSDYFYPLNKIAIDYSLSYIEKHYKNNISSYDIIENYHDEQNDLKYQYNLLKRFVKELKPKNISEIDGSVLIFTIENEKLIPFNDYSKENMLAIYKLITESPRLNQDLWEQLKINIRPFL